MRIAVVTRAARKIGGAETYIEDLLPALERAGHSVAVVFEGHGDRSRPAIQVPPKTQCWSAQDHGAALAILRLISWAPDLIYLHGLEEVCFEENIQRIAPSVFYAHDYYGQCISGSKTYARPHVMPCTREFGAACLACYLPRGCGGYSPITMLRRYRVQMRRLRLLRGYRRVLTNSEFLVRTFLEQGIAAECVYLFASKAPVGPSAIGAFTLPAPGEPWRLLFLGRAHALKGGELLLKSLPLVAEKIGRPLSVTFAGDGPALREWQRLAEKLRSDRIQISFVGWHTRTSDLFAETHLLVMPSVWPEPFGLSGLEAGLCGVPAVAFANGGIPEWLHEGENGHLAPATPPTSVGLADAIDRALSDSRHYLILRTKALARAREFSLSRHMDLLLRTFAQVTRERHAEPLADPLHMQEFEHCAIYRGR
ncbi:MAG TPA: glycosyltransferase family 4 protein [Terriglobales bacterium]|nr:glycosyltransferase family 4 protein [Terriglobales bacterium]